MSYALKTKNKFFEIIETKITFLMWETKQTYPKIQKLKT